MSEKTVDCTVCRRGIVWSGSKALMCEVCDGKGRLTEDELSRQLEKMVSSVASLPGAGLDPSDPAVALFRFQESIRPAVAEVESRFLSERGIKAKPGVKSEHLLPHEGGGKRSEYEQELQAMEKAARERKERYDRMIAAIESGPEGRMVPLLSFHEWCEGFTQDQLKVAGPVIQLSRCKPVHRAPYLLPPV
jgi:hypothetical protein